MTDSADLARISRTAEAVDGVHAAAAVLDRQLRPGTDPYAGAGAEPAAGTPVPGARPALVRGPDPDPGADAPTTVTEALLTTAARAPERGTTYVRADGSVRRQTYAALRDEALRVLTGLRRTGTRAGDPVLLQCADNRAFVTGFWACVLGGFVPTPVATAPEYRTDNAAVRKFHAAWRLLGRPLVLTDTGVRDRVAEARDRWDDGAQLRAVSVADVTEAEPAQPFLPDPDHPLVNLLTSGSTGTPKCVHHTHRSITARTHAAIAANGFTRDEVSLNWMPLDHVGGMVMFNVRDVFLGCEHVNAPTDAVVRRPLNWLDWIDRFRVTTTWAPNFAFALLTKHRAEIASGHWDLSCLRNICNAGEAVVSRTAFQFLRTLAPHGLPPDAMVPCWGMSETSSGVTYARLDLRDPAVGTVTLDSSSLDGQLVEVAPETRGALTLTEVGAPVAGVALRVVDEAGELLPEGRVGRVHVSGTTIMAGYLHNAAANAAGFTDDGWFDTGDLGFLRDGRLTLTGRQKHMLVVNGANYPAHEVESVVEQVPGVRPACTAACGVQDQETGTDSLHVFFVPTAEALGDLDGTVTGIRAALTRDIALHPESIVPVNEAEFPRAAGGKVQRERLAAALAEGRFDHRRYGGGPERGTDEVDCFLEPVWLPREEAGTSPTADRPTVLYAPAAATWPRRAAGAVGCVTPGERFEVRAADHVVIDPLDPEQHERALAHLVAHRGRPERIVYALETGPADGGRNPDAPARFLAALSAMARAAPEAELTVLTQEATGVRPADPVQPERAALVGMVRTAAAEGLLTAPRLTDAPPEAGGPELAELAGTRYGGEVVGVRGGAGYAPRLRTVRRGERVDVPTTFLPREGAVLLTGGLGGLGRHVAEQLLVGANARILIVGRTPEERLTPEAGAALAELRQLGEVRYAPVDVADRDGLAAAVTAAERAWGRGIDLVAHLAGSPVSPQWRDLSAHDLTRETPSWLRHMLRPKLDGGAAIEGLLDERPDTAVVLFSSVNGFLGGSGFGAYAAANAGLDAFAHRWAARGHAVRCLAWTMWDGAGMNDGNPLVAAARRRGLRVLEPADGLSLLLEALHQPAPYLLAGVDPANARVKAELAPDQFAGGSTVVAVVPEESADPETVRRAVAAELSASGVFAQITLLPRLPRDAAGAVDPETVLASRENTSPDHDAPRGRGETLVAGAVGDVLDLEPVGRDVSFFSLGCDSVRAVRLAGELSERLQRDVAVELLYEHPTVRDLAAAVSPGG
ncbi:acyl-CoA synthetase (AMP-forming)/AMP-acid ligase II [Haloactinospora alba]|uniref:Acyl-CoA synthetase (AMP-forming)/AMP-acid ligase II n=1 Tax=Haloactinospora alba TaxID=405555 RepID=A0A543N997_9ACTN|nr:SDR family NAD(P)-dependent oxidoreductase [Haloactinospora alba]TQN28379.1 acyl-CoA synthetase (AMP-forming)/AMP-acid ligase II [Haloactinospora alba]